jgi:hypothetical protein
MTSSGAEDGSETDSALRLTLLGVWTALELFLLLALVGGGSVVIYQNF